MSLSLSWHAKHFSFPISSQSFKFTIFYYLSLHKILLTLLLLAVSRKPVITKQMVSFTISLYVAQWLGRRQLITELPRWFTKVWRSSIRARQSCSRFSLSRNLRSVTSASGTAMRGTLRDIPRNGCGSGGDCSLGTTGIFCCSVIVTFNFTFGFMGRVKGI